MRVPDVMGVKIDTYSESLVSLWPRMLFAFRSCDTNCCAWVKDPASSSIIFRRWTSVRRDTRPSLAYGGERVRTHGCGCCRLSMKLVIWSRIGINPKCEGKVRASQNGSRLIISERTGAEDAPSFVCNSGTLQLATSKQAVQKITMLLYSL